MAASEPELQPFNEPIVEPASEAEVEAPPEPGVELESEPEASAEIWPEPGPEWDQSYVIWGDAWPLHVYLFAVLFLLIALFGIMLILSVVLNRSGNPVNKTTIMLKTMIVFFSATRGIALFLDPYSSTLVVPFFVSHMLWSVGIPGLTSSFSVVLLILLDTTKIQIAPPKFQKLSVIAAITFVHLVIVVVSDVLVLFFGSTVKAVLIFCQMLFVVYGLLVGIGFLYVGVKMRQNLSASQGGAKDATSKRLQRLTKSIYLSAVVALAISVTNLYSAVDIFGVFSTLTFVEAWPWWILQTFLRVEELLASFLVLSVFIKASPTSTIRGFILSMWCKDGGNVVSPQDVGTKIDSHTEGTTKVIIA